MLENLEDGIVTNDDLLFLVKEELEMIQGFCIKHKPKVIPPMLQVLDSTRQKQVIPLHEEKNFGKSQGRRQALMRIGAAFYQEYGYEVFPVVAILTSETWLKGFERDAVPEKLRQPSDYPDAIDSIMVQGMTVVKSSILETQPNPRAAMGVLEIKQRKPYIKAEHLLDASLMDVTYNTTDLLNHFFIGWMQRSSLDSN